jgi:hypothetical protein
VPAVGANKSINSELNNIPPTENNVKSKTLRCWVATEIIPFAELLQFKTNTAQKRI